MRPCEGPARAGRQRRQQSRTSAIAGKGLGAWTGSPWQKSEAKDPNQGPPLKTGARAFPESAHAVRGWEGGRCGATGPVAAARPAVLPRREPQPHPSLGSQGSTSHTELPRWLNLLTKMSEVITRGSGPQAAATEPLREQRGLARGRSIWITWERWRERVPGKGVARGYAQRKALCP